jgi:hypothetical protein
MQLSCGKKQRSNNMHNVHRETNLDGAQTSFERLAEQRPPGFLSEMQDFLVHNKKWWLTPIVVILLMLGALILMSGTAAAPFIYTLF